MAIALALASVGPAYSKPVLDPVTGAAGRGAATGAWIVGGLMVSSLSLIVCSQVVGKATGKQLTTQQAWTYFSLPFGCLWLPKK